jgi:hypothetical protein
MSSSGEKFVKLVAMISRKPGMTPEEFEDYYEKHHVTMSLDIHHETFHKYTRNFIQHDSPFTHLSGDLTTPCDVITEVWFREKDFPKFLETANKPEVRRRVIEDESNFMDRNSLRMFIVTEHEGPPSQRGA